VTLERRLSWPLHTTVGIHLHFAEGDPASERPTGNAQLETDERRPIELRNPGALVRFEALSEGQSGQRGREQCRRH